MALSQEYLDKVLNEVNEETVEEFEQRVKRDVRNIIELKIYIAAEQKELERKIAELKSMTAPESVTL